MKLLKLFLADRFKGSQRPAYTKEFGKRKPPVLICYDELPEDLVNAYAAGAAVLPDLLEFIEEIAKDDVGRASPVFRSKANAILQHYEKLQKS